MELEDILTGIVTGLIVGLILWFIQIGQNKRELRDQCEGDLLILKLKLTSINYDEKVRDINSIQASLPRYVKETINLLQDYPIELFSINVKKNKKLAKKLFEIKFYYIRFLKYSKKLDNIIDIYIRENNVEETMFPDDIVFKYFFVGKIYNSDDEKIRPWLNNLGEINNEMKDLFNEFKKEYSELIKNHLEIYDVLIGATKELGDLLEKDD